MMANDGITASVNSKINPKSRSV